MTKIRPWSVLTMFMHSGRCLALFGCLLSFVCTGWTQNEPDMTVSAEMKSEVISNVLQQLKSKYVFTQVSTEMEKAIRSRVAEHQYDAITSARQFAERLQSDLRAVSKDQHLELDYSYQPIPAQNEDQQEKIDPEREARIRYRGGLVNYWFKNADILSGNIGYLRFDGFFPLKDGGHDAADSAMTFLQHTSALIIDLRKNRGGDPAVGEVIMGYLFDKPAHIGDFLSRPDNSSIANWINPHASGTKYAGDVYVLVSRETISAAEGFAYDLQCVRRGTVIGEHTAGAAHPAFDYRVGEHFTLTIPTSRYVSAVTGTDWEGAGVVPDVSVSNEQALQSAELIALRKLIKDQPDYPFIDERKRTLDQLEKKTPN
jgi:C-terminal processing protease CtpA/Prc